MSIIAMSAPEKRKPLIAGAAVFAALFSAPAFAQVPASGNPPSTQSLEHKASCNPASVAQPATQSETHAAAGTAPGNTGSTGWTGGTGGAHTGTTPQGALPESKTWQPPTARGLDLAMQQPDTTKIPADC